MERDGREEKSRVRRTEKFFFTSLHSRSLSPRGVVRGGWALLLTAFMAAGCECSRGDGGSSSRL